MKRQIVLVMALISCVLIKQLLAGDGEKYAIKLADFNSKKADYSPMSYNGELLYVSNNRVTSFIHRYNKMDGEKMYDIVYNGENKIILSLLEKINSKYNEGPLTAINGGKTVFFTRNNYNQKKKIKGEGGMLNLQIFFVELLEDSSWSEAKSLPFNSADYNVGHPSFSLDEKTMYFSSDMPGSIGGADIYKVDYSNGNWGTPQNLGITVNTSEAELFPHMSSKGALYYSSNREGGIGGLDIYKSELKKGIFTIGENVGAPLNSENDDFGIISIVDVEGNEIGYFSSNREGGVGSDDIYEWVSLIKPLIVVGRLYKKIDGSPIANTVINITNSDGKVQQVMTDADGNYTYPLKRGEDYIFDVISPDVFNEAGSFSGKVADSQTEVKNDIAVEEWPYLYGEVKDESGKLLEGVIYTIKKEGKAVYRAQTDTDGVVKYILPSDAKVGDLISYTLEYKKEDYLATNKSISQRLINAGKNPIKNGEVVLIENKVGVDIATIIKIKPIYYEYNKADITPTAAVELDKIVTFLKDNPTVFIELASHTDARGSARYNFKLSDRRAKSAAKYIQGKIDNPKRIYGKGYGESKLKNKCTDRADCTEEQHAENRRTEFTIVK